MVLKLYKMELSPPVRAAMMACDILNLEVEMIDVNLRAKEQLSPEYLQFLFCFFWYITAAVTAFLAIILRYFCLRVEKNPAHTVPMLEHDDLIISDSHAIMMYLFDVFGNDDKFYPKDLKKRAIINQRLFFDTAILFPRLRNVSYPAIMEGVRTVTEKQLKDIEETYHIIEQYLSKSKYIAGDNITIADISTYADVTSLMIINPLDGIKYPKTEAWINEMGNQPYSQKYNAPGLKILQDILKQCLDI